MFKNSFLALSNEPKISQEHTQVLTGHGAAPPFTSGTNYLLSVIQPASPSLYGSTQTFTLL